MEDSALTLYQGTTSVCVVKVRLVLEEKGLAYQGPILNLQNGDQFKPEYLKLNPNAAVPTLLHQGNIIVESSVIMNYLEDLFASPSLLPKSALDRARMRMCMKEIDEYVFPACGTLTLAISFRKVYLAKPKDVLERMVAANPKPSSRARTREILRQGVESPMVVEALKTHDKMMRRMEQTLSTDPWLAGPAYSLADAAVTPFVNRLGMIGLIDCWSASCPRVMDWFERVKARPSFAAAITRFYDADDAERFRPGDAEDPARVRRLIA